MATRVHRSGNPNGNPNSKIVSTNKKLGVPGIQNQQATTRVIYDAVKLNINANDGTYYLFRDVKNHAFPQTNLTENKLQVAESIAFARMYFGIMITESGNPDALDGVNNINYFPQFQRLNGSLINFQIAQDEVIVQQPLFSLYAPFNHNARFGFNFADQGTTSDPIRGFQVTHDVYHFNTPLIIPPQIQFFCQVQTPPIPAFPSDANDFYLFMGMEGLGSLFAPKARY